MFALNLLRSLRDRFFNPANRIGYRADVDGLRALAVLVILFFHLDMEGFAGGFVGVDIFFVISGYVILRRTIPEIETGHFSLKRFYERRLRRIAPGLLLILFGTLIAGYWLQGPKAYEETSQSLLASLLMGPNFFFHDRSGYFAASAYERPLLHLWSLGIEEQFYLLIPLLLLAGSKLKKGASLWIIGIVVAASLIYCLYTTPFALKRAFYMPMARLWEIGIGGLIAFAEQHRRPQQREAAAWSIFGLALVLLSVFFFDSETPFPGSSALLPVLGTAFLIYAGSSHHQPATSRLLSHQSVVTIGLASYALYLVHWPLIVFARMAMARPLNEVEKIPAALALIGLSLAVWHIVEKPFRKGPAEIGIRKVGLILGNVALFLAILAGALALSDGWPQRLSAEARQVQTWIEQNEAQKPACTEPGDLFHSPDKKVQTCLYGDATATSQPVILWGDSHAGVYAKALGDYFTARSMRLLFLSLPNCPPLTNVQSSATKNRDLCPNFTRQVADYIHGLDKPLVLIGSRWANLGSPERAPGDGERARKLADLENNRHPIPLDQALVRTLDTLTRKGARVVVIGPTPEIPFDVPDTLTRVANGAGRLPEVPRTAFDLRQSETLPALRLAERISGVSVVYPHKSLCDKRQCMVHSASQPLYTDDDHLSLLGVEKVWPDFKRTLDEIVESSTVSR